MMAILFVIYFVSQLFILWKKEQGAFALIALNAAFSLLMLLHHETNILRIRL
jgi:hypothetical protein